ncbi:hypothetical protein ERO13_A10G136701v2 [Gossypium hirsutum]|nr:hypothetical protein ERO13_A10G136701v2 [Gossypium hirsutum]
MMLSLEPFPLTIALKLLIHLGMLPKRLFSARSKIWRELRAHKWSGMLPPNLFDRRIRIIRFVRSWPSHLGMLPSSSFFPRLIATKFVQFFSVKGISP